MLSVEHMLTCISAGVASMPSYAAQQTTRGRQDSTCIRICKRVRTLRIVSICEATELSSFVLIN